jgi:hypothetical protein
MSVSRFGLWGVVSMVLFSTTGWAQTVSIQNGGFETSDRPAAWTVDRAPVANAGSFGIDQSVAHTGARSLVVRHEQPASFRLLSAPLKLEVGKLYRLSGWIRTDKASPDLLARYPTALPAVLTMASFPFTNTSMPVGGTREWTKSEVVFIATQSTDQVVIEFGANGKTTGTAWFDDLQLEKVEDVSAYIPLETVRWYGPAFRYTDKGWTFVHIEGEPYQRGFQYGYLLAKEIGVYLDKLATQANPDNPRLGWDNMRTLTDAMMLRQYDEEYLVEMRGIADGAAKGGAVFSGKPVDFLDVVTINSAVDLGQLGGALAKSETPLTGRSFRKDEEEASALERLHKCSSFLANGPASKDGRIVFAQLFMWGGYTGVHWDVICDVVPTRGHRLVYETFPGGIHSAADFYINAAGIMIGETTVMQTAFNVKGEPQSSRIRKAAQYSSGIDDVVRILTTGNNGLYTNDWLIGDAKTDETAILLLGTEKHRLWRSAKGDFPGGTTGFFWSVNNAKDPEVRKEYVPDPSNAPFDVVFGPVNRDIEFFNYFQREKGKIDAISAVNTIATSPINRPHACDGKVTTSEMAEKMVFMAHFGKVTLREKFPEKGSRRMPDLPNAIPHLTLGYTVFSPVTITEMLKAVRASAGASATSPRAPRNLGSAKAVSVFDRKFLWSNTVYPAREKDNWFVSGTAAYWQMLNALPADAVSASTMLRDQFADLNYRLQYTMIREGSLAPAKADRRYDAYKSYIIPRVRGTILLHQLRLRLGNEVFGKVMEEIHTAYRGRPLSTEEFVKRAEKCADTEIGPIVAQWLEREDLPDPKVNVSVTGGPDKWSVDLEVVQAGKPYQFLTTVSVETEQGEQLELVEVTKSPEHLILWTQSQPVRVVFNAGNDIPVRRPDFFTYANLFDDFKTTSIVYGTSREVEANRTLALRFQGVLADQFTEDLLPVRQDNAISDDEVSKGDLVILGNGGDNELLRRCAEKIGLDLGQNLFRWQGKTYGNADDGLFLAVPNPLNATHALHCFVANSCVQLWQMTKRYQPLPAWALFKGEQITERGYLPAGHLVLELSGK